MALTNINEILRKEVQYRLQNAQSGLCALEVSLYSSDNPDKNHIVKPLLVENYVIMQDFTKTYTDVVLLTVNVSPSEFFTLVNNHKNLNCTIISYPVLEGTRQVLYNFETKEPNISQEGWIHTYRAVILGLQDILQEININQLVKTENNNENDVLQSQRMKISLQLINTSSYDVRTRTFALPLRNVTVKQAIYAAANTLGIKNIYLQEPDNKQVYPHITFPAMQTLESFIPLLQKTYGIYKEGVEYYFTNDTLYIYPGYKIDPNRNDPIVNIYKVPDNYYPGLFGYHSKDVDNNLYIVSDSIAKVEDKANANLENIGNNVLTLDTEKTLDLSRQVNGFKGTFNSNNLLSITMKNVEGNTTNRNKSIYLQGSSNPFQMSSLMMKDNKIEVTLGWHNPLPYLINPGQRCIYHYEDEVGYKTKIGIIESVSYVFDISTRTSDYIYKSTAILRLRLASDSETLVDKNEENITTDINKDNKDKSIFDIVSDMSLDKFKSLLNI